MVIVHETKQTYVDSQTVWLIFCNFLLFVSVLGGGRVLTHFTSLTPAGRSDKLTMIATPPPTSSSESKKIRWGQTHAKLFGGLVRSNS